MKKLLITLIIFGILSIQSIYSKLDETIITEKDNDGFVGVAVGDILILKLEANLGTGNAWHVIANDPDLLELLGEPKVEPIEGDAKKVKKEEALLVGQPERMVFRFKARSSGPDVLELHYFRIFEEEEKVKLLKTFKITVLIH